MKPLSTSPCRFGGFNFGSASSAIQKEPVGNNQQSALGHSLAWSSEFSDFLKKEQKMDGGKTSGPKSEKDFQRPRQWKQTVKRISKARKPIVLRTCRTMTQMSIPRTRTMLRRSRVKISTEVRRHRLRMGLPIARPTTPRALNSNRSIFRAPGSNRVFLR